MQVFYVIGVAFVALNMTGVHAIGTVINHSTGADQKSTRHFCQMCAFTDAYKLLH